MCKKSLFLGNLICFRFLFPVYPIICLSGAITVDILQKLCFRIWTVFRKMPTGTHYLDKTIFIMITAIVVTSLLGNNGHIQNI